MKMILIIEHSICIVYILIIFHVSQMPVKSDATKNFVGGYCYYLLLYFSLVILSTQSRHLPWGLLCLSDL